MTDLPGPIYISYSHKDARLVRPIVRLLRATKDLVFQDIDSIRPGRKWRPQTDIALIEAKLIVLFWCRHSKKSKEVKNEYKNAIKSKKNILPLLLDESELPDDLGEFEWVDFRKLSRYNHKSCWAWVKTILVPLLGLSAMVITLFVFSPRLRHPAGGYTGGSLGPDWPFLIIIALMISSLLIYFLLRSRRRKKSNNQMAQGMYEKIIKLKHEELMKE